MRPARENMCRGARYHKTPHLVFCLTFFLVCVAIASATDQNSHQRTFVLKPDTTSIRWTLSGTVHTVRGTFKLKRGAVDVNLDDGSADGLVEVDANSGESGNSARDELMHKSILESDRYPIISFRPTHVIGKVPFSGDEIVTVEGVFRIHGTEHPLQLRIDLHPEGDTIALKTHFIVPYVNWGMKDPSILFLRVDKTVDIDVEATISAGE